MKLIDKDALVADMERRRDAALMRQRNLEAIGEETVINEMVAFELNRIISLINTLEVKEVDDETECKIYPRPAECYSTCKECPWLATNNKVQKGE